MLPGVPERRSFDYTEGDSRGETRTQDRDTSGDCVGRQPGGSGWFDCCPMLVRIAAIARRQFGVAYTLHLLLHRVDWRAQTRNEASSPPHDEQ